MVACKVHVEPVAAGERLRIAAVADFDGPHARSWLRWFIDRGHDVHAVSFYPPATAVEGATMHALRPERRQSSRGASATDGVGRRVPRGLMRLAHALRYQRAGLARAVARIAPDVLHGHFIVEHGFYAATLGRHPYVVTAWGSDVLVEPGRDPVSRRIARWTLRRADLATSNNRYMAQRMVALGADPDRTHVITLGADTYFLEDGERSVNARPAEPGRVPCVISTRAHEPLYNVDEIIDAYGRALRAGVQARLVVLHGGAQTAALRAQAEMAGGNIEFGGYQPREAFRAALHDAEVFVSVPSSDGTSVALLQAMAAGCFPVVSDLATQRELVEDGVNGFRVPPHRPDLLGERIAEALRDERLRRAAVERNREIVRERGLNEREMAKMEALYREVAGRA